MGIVQINGTDTINISGTAGVVAKLGVGIVPTARLTLAAGGCFHAGGIRRQVDRGSRG